MNKPNVLYVGAKYTDSNPEFGNSFVVESTLPSLEAMDTTKLNRFYTDVAWIERGGLVDDDLLALCEKTQPEMILLNWRCSPSYNARIECMGGPENPRLATLKTLGETMSIPIVALWWDHVWDIHIRNAEMIQKYVRLNVVADTSSFFPKVSCPEKYLKMWSVQDPRLFYDPKAQRNIPISFIGRAAKRGRDSKIDLLKRENIGFINAGGQKENPISFVRMAEVYRDSKIVVNFSDSISGIRQLTGRTTETTLAGAMLLEEDNAETRKMFIPFVEYVPYESAKDLVDKAKYYLAHEEERAAIATRGHEKACRQYSNQVYWRTIFNKVLPGHAVLEVELMPDNAIIESIQDTMMVSPDQPSTMHPSLAPAEMEKYIGVLIPTLNRSDYLIRALRYYADVGFKGWICIGDSSTSEQRNKIGQAMNSVKKRLNLLYAYLPKSEYANDGLCLKKLIDMTPTPYAVYSGDDDMLVPASLSKCAAFLDDHPEYSAAHGIRLSYALQSEGVSGEIKEIRYIQQHILEHETAADRWAQYARHAVSTQYYIHRKESWKRMYQDVATLPGYYFPNEFLPCSLSVISGKVKQLECLSTVFQIQPNNRRSDWFFRLMRQPAWSAAVQGTRRCCVEAIMQMDGLTSADAQQIFDKEFWYHIKSLLYWQYQAKYGATSVDDLPTRIEIVDLHRNLYQLIMSELWPNRIAVLRPEGCKMVARQMCIDEERAAPIYDRGLWYAIMVQLHQQYRRTYGDDPAVGAGDTALRHNRVLSLKHLLNPSSGFYSDFLPVYQTIKDAIR